jgi:hypothetical protein
MVLTIPIALVSQRPPNGLNGDGLFFLGEELFQLR